MHTIDCQTQLPCRYATRSQPRGSPLDHTRLAQDPAVQDAAAPVGTRAPLPATRADAGLANVNALRCVGPPVAAVAWQ